MKGIREKLFGRGVLVATAAFWVIGLCVGATALLKYAGTPGLPSTPPPVWPVKVPFSRSNSEATLLVFLHPECPCSRATVDELAQLVASRGAVRCYVVFYAPALPDWSGSDLYEHAYRIPGVRVLKDRDGTVGKSFGARTSGEAVLYDAQGHLSFHGGITATRGHVAPNDGLDAIVDLIHGKVPTRTTTPVFGCALYGAS